MSDLLKALDQIIFNLDQMTDEQLQAKFDAHEVGVVGAAISDMESFMSSHESSSFWLTNNYPSLMLEKTSVHFEVIQKSIWSIFRKETFKVVNSDSLYFEDAANDEHYAVAA